METVTRDLLSAGKHLELGREASVSQTILNPGQRCESDSLESLKIPSEVCACNSF